MDIAPLMVSTLLGILIGGASVYFTAYIKEKGKNLALKEDNAKLEEEKQRIISKYQRDIEEQKKSHQLDIEKRKYQYESKKSQYYNFMNELDNFQGCALRTLADDFSQIMLSFYASMHNVSQSSKKELTVEFNEKAFSAVKSLKEQRARLFSQLNGFKLSANKEVVELLEELSSDIEKSEQSLVHMLEYIGSTKFQFTEQVPMELLAMSDNNKSDIVNTKEKLIIALKKDLNEI